MKDVNIEQTLEKFDFINRAKEHFEQNSHYTSYSDGNIKNGEYLALRWGLHGKAILLLKNSIDPECYGDIIDVDNYYHYGQMQDAVTELYSALQSCLKDLDHDKREYCNDILGRHKDKIK